MKTIALTGGGSAGHVVPHLSMPSTRHGAKEVFCSIYNCVFYKRKPPLAKRF